jgi:hypothetical protein
MEVTGPAKPWMASRLPHDGPLGVTLPKWAVPTASVMQGLFWGGNPAPLRDLNSGMCPKLQIT